VHAKSAQDSFVTARHKSSARRCQTQDVLNNNNYSCRPQPLQSALVRSHKTTGPHNIALLARAAPVNTRASSAASRAERCQ